MNQHSWPKTKFTVPSQINPTSIPSDIPYWEMEYDLPLDSIIRMPVSPRSMRSIMRAPVNWIRRNYPEQAEIWKNMKMFHHSNNPGTALPAVIPLISDLADAHTDLKKLITKEMHRLDTIDSDQICPLLNHVVLDNLPVPHEIAEPIPIGQRKLSHTIHGHSNAAALFELNEPLRAVSISIKTEICHVSLPLKHKLKIKPYPSLEESLIDPSDPCIPVSPLQKAALNLIKSDIDLLTLKILHWNPRSIARPSFAEHFDYIDTINTPHIVILTETRLSGPSAKSIIYSLPFARSIIVDPLDFAGGIVLLWNPDHISVSMVAKREQELHVIVQVSFH